MDVLKVLLLFFLFPFLCKAQNVCPTSYCGRNHFVIRFPFQFKHQQSWNCGYPGFNLTCNPQDKVVLNIPNCGDFFVRNIDYRDQVIQLYDPFKCLPNRLLGLNLAGSPFAASVTRNYTFLSCPSEVTQSRLTTIDCLSNSSMSTIATSSMSLVAGLTNQTDCQIIATVPVPVPVPEAFQSVNEFSSELKDDLYLTWDTPNCQDCEANGGTCRFSNNSKQQTMCSYHKTGRTGGSLQVFKIIALSIAVPAIVCSIIITFFICIFGDRRATNSRQQNLTLATVTPETPTVTLGLDESTIESYTKVILGESMRVPGRSDATCPICLADYNAKETVRCIPECRHCFHAECIDEWLRLNGTCPVCRNSPSPAHANT